MKTVMLAFLLFNSAAHAVSLCAGDLGHDATTDLLSYLEALIDQHVLGIEQVTQLGAYLRNPLAQERSVALRIHSAEIDNYLRDGEIDRELIARWAAQKTAQMAVDTEDRQSKSAQTSSIIGLGKFVAIKGGRYWRVRAAWDNDGVLEPESTGRIDVDDFEIMDAPVTQAQWVADMGINPSTASNDPLRPVETVTFASVAYFANLKSIQIGLEPYYDFKRALLQGTAADGNLRSSNDEIHRTQSNGFRVPFESEYDYLITNRGESVPRAELAEETLGDYAWVDVDPGEASHVVKTKKPILFDGEEIFDLLGNVSEWSSAFKYFGQTDVLSAIALTAHVAVRHRHFRNLNLGFRLARTRK